MRKVDRKLLVGTDIGLGDGLWTGSLLRQTISLLTVSPPLSSQSMDKDPHILWHCYYLRLLYSNHRDVWGTLHSKAWTELDGVRLLSFM